MKKGTSFEILNKQIFQTILDQEEVNTIDVQHDVRLKGKTTTHQIDVYWEFELAGISYKTVVQTKDWKNPVNKGELLKFKAVLDDIPGQPTGIFVTSSGYQKGACEFANGHGIKLFELGELKDEPLKLEIPLGSFASFKLVFEPVIIIGSQKKTRTFRTEAIVHDLKFINVKVHPDADWLQKELGCTETETNDKISNIQYGKKKPVDHKFYDENGTIVNDLQQIHKTFSDKIRGTELKLNDVSHQFDEPTYIKTENFIVTSVKILSITATVMVSDRPVVTSYARFKPDIVQFILKDLTEQTVQIIKGK